MRTIRLAATIALTVAATTALTPTVTQATTTPAAPVMVLPRAEWVPAWSVPCAQEDSAGPCYWDAGDRGNGYGDSFYVDGSQRVHYVGDAA